MPSSLTTAEITTIAARERQRVAHDLHDGLGQLLGGIALKLQSLHETLAEAKRPEAGHTAELVQLVNEAISQTRRLARGLDPVPPQTLGLAGALTKLAEDTERLFRVKCSFRGTGGEEPASTLVVEQFFRVAQESINNAIRHGRATRLELELSLPGREAVLLIRDNGTGLAQRADPKSGIGLRIMNHRLGVVGGTLRMEAGAGGGTVVHCRVPLPVPAGA